jgi:hypothetical protein
MGRVTDPAKLSFGGEAEGGDGKRGREGSAEARAAVGKGWAIFVPFGVPYERRVTDGGAVWHGAATHLYFSGPCPDGGTAYTIYAIESGKWYSVRWDPPGYITCDCPARRTCKHIRMAKVRQTAFDPFGYAGKIVEGDVLEDGRRAAIFRSDGVICIVPRAPKKGAGGVERSTGREAIAESEASLHAELDALQAAMREREKKKAEAKSR